MYIAGIQFRFLDENADFGLVAPQEETPSPVGINLFVDDIYELEKKIKELGCEVMYPVTDYGHGINTVFKDKFGHVWVVNQDMDKLSR